MPVTFNQIASNTASVTIPIENVGPVTIVYYPNKMTDKYVADLQAGNVVDKTQESSDKASHGIAGMFKNALSFAGSQAIFAGIGFLKDQIGGIFTESMNAQQ